MNHQFPNSTLQKRKSNSLLKQSKFNMEQGQKKVNTLSKDDKTSNRMKRKPMFDETGNILLNGVKLTFERGFGFNQNPSIQSPAHCIDDNKVVYLLGKQIIQYDMLTENQKVVDQIDQEEQITSFMYFKNLMLDDNIMYAIHAMNKTYPSIIAKNYSKNLTQKYVMAHLEKQQKVVSLMLICENKYIVALSQLQGTYRLSYVQVQTKEVLANESIYFKVSGMFIPQAYQKCIILYTASELYMVQFGQQIKPITLGLSKFLQAQSEQIIEAISSVFTSNDIQLYIITTKGNLLFVNINTTTNKISSVEPMYLGDFQTVDEVTGKQVVKNRMPSSICCNEYNILIGYQFVEEFTLVKICPVMTGKPISQKIPFSCPNLHKIVRMQFAHETMSICVIVQVKENDRFDLSIPIQSDYLKQKGEQTSNKQTLANHLLPPGKIFPVIFNMLLHDTLVQTLRSPIQSILGWMLFVKEILDVAILPTKKIMLILSKERKIKAVKYQHLSSTSFERMLIWEMHFNQNDCPATLDIHPLTFNVAIGFKEGLKLFTISSQGLKPNNIQFPLKNCESVRYSKFGHKLMAGSSNQILIINPYQNKILHTISLSSGYNIKELSFIDRDLYVFCQYTNGSNQIMNCEGNRIFQVWKKQSKTICSAYDSIFDVMVVSYTENFTKFYRQRGSQEFGVLWTYPFNVTKILIVNELGTIFMGTSMGKIRAYQWPFTDMMRFSKSFTEIQLHSSPITRLRIIHDFSLLISGAEDGSIFISKINAYSDGIAITDSEIMHSLKSNSKNYTNLFYLQNYMITSSVIEFGQQETIVQLQSDKADFETQYSDVIACIQHQNDQRLKKEQKQRQIKFKEELQGRQAQIQELNEKKIQLREKISEILKKKAKQEQQLQYAKEQRMRQLYKERDELCVQKQKLEKQYDKEKLQHQYRCKSKLTKEEGEWKAKQDQLLKQISVVEKDYQDSILTYKELLKQEAEQGVIYKNKMLEELQEQLQQQKQSGQKLRKTFNKIRHDSHQLEQKLKTFQQMIGQIQIDTISNQERFAELKQQQSYLTGVLVEKDKIILEEEKSVKQLLAHNINNYTHEEYLKHKQEELLQKVNFLEQEIVVLDEKYNNFQNDFVHVTNESNELREAIANAKADLMKRKEKDQALKQELYMKKYKNKQLVDNVETSFLESKCDKSLFMTNLEDLLSQFSNNSSTGQNLTHSASPHSPATNKLSSTASLLATLPADSSQEQIQKRDHLIKQVVNTNKLRKIDDNIRRTIMIKLNRQTVSLTCEVNELRKEKKKLATKIKQLKFYIDEITELEGGNKQNLAKTQNKLSKTSSVMDHQVDDIVPANISIIRSKPSKHINTYSSRQKLLPFQVYHNNKSKHSYHSRNVTKGDFDESSTQLPSMFPSILKNNSISEESSRLFNVAEIDGDEIRNC